MGSLDNGAALKRAGATAGRPFFHRPRSRLSRLLLSEKVDYFQWICTIAAFFFVVVLFQSFLPGFVVEKSSRSSERRLDGVDLGLLKEIGDLEFGEGIQFVPNKLLARLERERREEHSSSLGRPVKRFGLRRPQLALVVPDLEPDAMQLQMVSIAMALREIGYDIHVYSFEDGSVHSVWKTIGMPVSILPIKEKPDITVDWLNYNGILVNSIVARPVISCFLQEPFKSVPIIWTVHEKILALNQTSFAMNGQNQLINEWKQAFSRAKVVVFPTHLLPMMYSAFDAGNFLVIPGTHGEAWEAAKVIARNNGTRLRINMGYSLEDFVVVIVGSQFSYSGMWLEHALVLQALAPLLQEFPSHNSSYPLLKIIILSDNSTSAYKTSLEIITQKFGYPKGSVEQIFADGDMSNFLSIADLVIYGSFLEEPSFPPVLLQAMCLGKLVISPDLRMINKYVDDKVNGYLFPKDNLGMLTQILLKVVYNGKLSLVAQKIALISKSHARNVMVSETIDGYALLLENVVNFPSEVASPKAVTEIPIRFKQEWQWYLFEDVMSENSSNIGFGRIGVLKNLEDLLNLTHFSSSLNYSSSVDEAFSSITWEEEKKLEMVNVRKRLEEEELKDRTDQPHGTWEEVYRNVKKADRAKNELHERDDGELERTGQPLCIYEPYFGEGVWPLLHHSSLYRGIGLSSKGRRPGADDIDASSRLMLLNNAYYRDVLGEFGAFFALGNRIDRIHKNAWIGFHSWRATARKASLSKKAENSLLDAIQAHRHGDALYFWIRMDKDPRNPLQQEFWSFCDAINAGNCRAAVSESLRRMYGLEHDWNSLPPMPMNGDSWSVMHSWALPTRSFLEFVMFARMFVDALDAQIYDEHHQSGLCYLSISKDRHCYSRVLELLINVWAYHSARRMVYVNPESGVMQEQHRFKTRKGQMWVRWLSFSTLKTMDEDLAEEADSEHPVRRWLWPSTGEVFWQGIYERERNTRQQEKERRKQHSKDKIRRIRKRARQKTLGRFIKPPEEDTTVSNTTTSM